METETGLFGRNAPRTKPSAGLKKVPPGDGDAAEKQNDDKSELRDDCCSVFISNLAFTLQEPEATLKALFESCGSIAQVRPIFGHRGVFRGYCYVQFESPASVTEALKLDRREVEGRPMFVSPCVDKNKNPDFKVCKNTHQMFFQAISFLVVNETILDAYTFSACSNIV